MKIFTTTFIIVSALFYIVVNNKKEQPVALAVTNYVDPYNLINDGMNLLKEGDLVVRLNTSPGSMYIKDFNRQNKSYSHAGVVLFENGKPFIYHIVNGEENPNGRLRKDSLVRFCDPRKNVAFGIFRYDLKSNEVKILKNVIRNWLVSGVQFDSTFNLKTDKYMYCSEMISKALAKATHRRIIIGTTKVTATEARFFSAYMHLPFSYTKQLKIVSIDNLYIHPSCRLIKEYSYGQTE